MKKKLVVCGGGSSAHTLIPFLKDSIFDVSIYTSRPSDWAKTINLEWHDPSGNVLGTFSGDVYKASNNPKELFSDADYVVLCMPVHKYRVALNTIAPFLSNDKNVFIGTLYGQGGFNWMVDEIKKKFHLSNIVTFAFGLIPWVCRIIDYGHKGVTYGCKVQNYAAVYPRKYFNEIKEEFFEQICYKWFGKGHVHESENFISLTLSVDNQIIHPSRCLGLYKVYGRTWKSKEDVPWFYKDYDDVSAKILSDLDADYSRIRQKIIEMYPSKNFTYMLDYLKLEHFSYQSSNTDIKESFLNSQTLVSIKTPVVCNENGLWEIDRNHRFFLDDIYYGICIAKWIAEKLRIETPTINAILKWAEIIRCENILGENNMLDLASKSLREPLKSGVPCFYGINNIEGIVD